MKLEAIIGRELPSTLKISQSRKGKKAFPVLCSMIRDFTARPEIHSSLVAILPLFFDDTLNTKG